MCTSPDITYKRIADVIQVNMANNPKTKESYADTGFKLKSCRTYYSIDTKVRVKPMMVALPYATEWGTDTLLTNFDWNTFTYKTVEGY